MADMVETMAYAGEIPWHQKGNPVDSSLTPAEMTKAAGIDWTVDPVLVQGVDWPFFENAESDSVNWKALGRGKVRMLAPDWFADVQLHRNGPPEILNTNFTGDRRIIEAHAARLFS